MSWYTSDTILAARRIGRSLGLNRRIAAWLNGSGYETRYERAFLAALAHGDCVWDVGANVGHYSRLFADRVGSSGGGVIAFEPSPINFARLRSACADRADIRLLNIGLGETNDRMAFEQGADELGATSRVVVSDSGRNRLVEIRCGADLIDVDGIPAPNVLKIDVEGFELEVIRGMRGHLARPSLRTVGIEVHFRILSERGLRTAPQEIERILHANGYRVAWADASHILATRSE